MLELVLLAATLAANPPPLPSPAVVRAVAALDDDDFERREEAQRYLASSRRRAELHVRGALARHRISPEQRQRLRALVSQWARADDEAAHRAFDCMFPGPLDVPHIDGAWYDVARGGYTHSCWPNAGIYARLEPWLASSVADDVRFPREDLKAFPENWGRYRVATRRWGIACLRDGVPSWAVWLAVSWIKARDDVFINDHPLFKKPLPAFSRD